MRGRLTLPAVFLLSAVTGSLAAAETVGQRILHFPADRSLGRVLICEPVPDEPLEGFFYWIRGEDWAYLAEAQGDVTVPAGKWVSLNIEHRESWRDLSPLLDLQADDLYRLGIHGSYTGGAKPSDTCMQYLAHLTGLRVLDLDKTNVTGAGMKWVSGLQHLRRLILPDCISDAGLAHVARLSALTGLYFRENRVTNAGLKHLAGLQGLEELALGGGRITDDGLIHLAPLTRLRYLLLQGKNLTDAGFVHLKNVPSLRILHFGHLPQTTDAGLAHLSALSNVQDLSFHWSENITDAGLEYLAKLPHLRALDVGNAKITDEGLAHLKEAKTLEWLDLPHEGISDRGLADLSELPRLRKLDICRVHYVDPNMDQDYYTDKGVAMLAKCRLLEELSVGSIGITDASMAAIAKLDNLRQLTLFGCTSVTDEGLKKLVSLKNLERLAVTDADISISGLSCLNELPNLRILNLKDVKQDHTGLDLSNLKKLDKLTMGTRRRDDPINDTDVACLAGLTQLTWFQVSQSVKKPHGLTDHGLAHLAGLTQMDRLTVGGPDLTDEGLKRLENLTALAHLNLIGEHRFSQEDIRHLFETLPNLYRFRTGVGSFGQTILREKILAASPRRRPQARPARSHRPPPRRDTKRQR